MNNLRNDVDSTIFHWHTIYSLQLCQRACIYSMITEECNCYHPYYLDHPDWEGSYLPCNLTADGKNWTIPNPIKWDVLESKFTWPYEATHNVLFNLQPPMLIAQIQSWLILMQRTVNALVMLIVKKRTTCLQSQLQLTLLPALRLMSYFNSNLIYLTNK